MRSSAPLAAPNQSFDMWPGHPREAEVRKLLATTRSMVIPLWEEVLQHNESSGIQAEGGYQVHYYCGQYVVEDEEQT